MQFEMVERFTFRPRAVVLVGLAWAVLFASVLAATRRPGREIVPGLGEQGVLDYSSRPGFLTPLSDTFIERQLGRGSNTSVYPKIGGGGPLASVFEGVDPLTHRRVVRHDLTNDSPDHAYGIASVPFSAHTDSSAATRNGDPNDCSSVGGTTWYRFTPSDDMGLIAYTFGTDHAVALGVFERTANSWRLVTPCDTDESGNALIHFQATRGTSYLFQVTDVVRGSDLRFNLDPQGTITLASASPKGEPANGDTWSHNATPDGRYVSIFSQSNNLGDRPASNCDKLPPQNYSIFDLSSPTHPCYQDYIYDRLSRKLSIVSMSAAGQPGDGHSYDAAVSGNGRYYIFESDAHNLGPNDPPGYDLFLKDLRTGAVELIATAAPLTPTQNSESDPSMGEHVEQHVEGNVGYFFPSLSDDGRYVAFQTPKAILPEDTNLNWDVYVYDRLEKRYELETVNSKGELAEPSVQRDANVDYIPASESSVDLTAYISANGRYVVFRSAASNLVPGDHNNTWDTFVRDRVRRSTERVSVSTDEQEGNGESMERLAFATPTITPDGHYVVFDSLATNLDPNFSCARAPEPVTQACPPSGVNSVYLRDRWKGTTRNIGINDGQNQPVTSHVPSITRNGRFITYTVFGPRSDYANCDNTEYVEGYVDHPYACFGDVLVYDMLTDTTIPITVLPNGADHYGEASSVSEDGSTVVFHSLAPDSTAIQVYIYEAARPR